MKKFIFASSAAVYGNPTYLGLDEKHQLNPKSFYGLSKVVAEQYIQLFSDMYNLDYSILRYANVFGPKQNSSGEGGVISIFMDRLLNFLPLTIYGDGEQTRDFVYVKDVAAANLAALTYGKKCIFNIGNNQQTSLNALVKYLESISNQTIQISYSASRTGDILHSCLNSTLARKELNWIPLYSLEDGLRETYYSQKNK